MMKKGIDISHWQEKIDFSKVKTQVDFVILREGYRKTIDKRFLEYVNGCKSNQIPIKGVYHFIYALNNQDVIKEAESCLANIEKAGLTKDCIVWCDFEYDTVTNAKKNGITLGKAECDLFTRTFCNFFAKRGYKTGIYCNLDYYKNMYSQSTLDKYPIWLADYSGDPDKPCLYHQYSSKGKISGINGNVDMNYYIGFGETVEENTMGMTVDKAIDKLISIATAEIGYLEKKNGNSLDSKTLNAGSNNYTKYWRDVKPSYQAQPWCACFVTWCMDRAFGQDKTRKLLKHYPFVYVPTLAGMTANKTPHKGDIVCFYRNGTFTHTGIVIAVNGANITTIEGNTSGGSTIIANGGGVCKKTYNIGNLSGTRFFRPDYSIVGETATGSGTSGSTTTQEEKVVKTVNLTQVQKGNKGKSVLLLQKLLMAARYTGRNGAGLALDGECGDNTVFAIKEYQRKHSSEGISVDGICGKATWTSILGM